jgi:hypothetical protein
MPANDTERPIGRDMPSGGAGERSGLRCHMRLKLLEFSERSKK